MLQQVVLRESDDEEECNHSAPVVKELPAHITGKDLEDELESGKGIGIKVNPRTRRETLKWMYKNVFGVGLSIFFVFSAFLGLQNLQSSLSPTIGLASLAILYLSFALSGFITPGLIKLAGAKYMLLFGFLCHLVYTIGFFYLSWYTLVLTSIILGLASGPVWAGASAHLVHVAIASAPTLERDQDHLISAFVGVFFFFFQGAQIPGNLASSLIFFPYNSSNTSFTSSVYDSCEQTEDVQIHTTYLYILVSVYFVLISLGITSLLIMVDHLPSKREDCSSVLKKMKLYFGDPVVELLKVMKDWRMVLVAPIAIVNGMEQSFLFGTFTGIISDCFGIYLVGFSIIAFGVTSALLSIAYGQLVRRIPRYTIFLFGGTINVSLLLFLLLWSPTPSYVVIFVFVICWGAADAAWNTMTASLVGILFPTKSEVAYSVHRIWLAVGFIMGFISTQIFYRDIRYLIMMMSVVIALFSNLLLEFKTQPIQTLLPGFISSRCFVSSCKNESASQKNCNKATQTVKSALLN